MGVHTSNGIRSIWHIKIEFVGKCTRLVEEHFGQIAYAKVAHVPQFLAIANQAVFMGMPNTVAKANAFGVKAFFHI